MAQRNKIDRFPATISGLLFLSVGLLGSFAPVTPFMGTLMYIYGTIIYFGIIFCWGIYIERSILSKKIRRLMLCVVALMIFYMIVRTAKHRIFLDGDFFGRLLWYLYYLPQIFATLLTFIIAYRVGKAEEQRLPKVFYALFAVGTLIVVGYLTNDIHQLAFNFNLDFVAWDTHYDWGPLFYVSTAWIYLFLLACVALLTFKSRAVNKKKAWVPVFWLFVGSVYIIMANFFHIWEVNPYNLPETHCFIVIAILESAIRLGLMPSNSAYGEIVAKSSAAFQLADYDNNIVFSSENAQPLDFMQMEQAKLHNILKDKDTLLLSSPISGGNIFWTEDISGINEMNERLEEIGKSLSEEGDLLKAENEFNEQRAKIAEQTRLYDSIALLVRPQLEKISRLVGAEGDFQKNMAHICVLNCYIKRRANLALLEYKEPLIGTGELYLSIKESAEYLRLYGVSADAYAEKESMASSGLILFCFDLWQRVIEESIITLGAVMVKIAVDGESLLFRISLDTPFSDQSLSDFYQRAKNLGGELETEYEDSTTYVTFSVKERGESL